MSAQLAQALREIMAHEDFGMDAKVVERARKALADYDQSLSDLECPPAPETVDRAITPSSQELKRHAAKGRTIVKRLYNDPADTISMVSVGEWIEYADQLLMLSANSVPVSAYDRLHALNEQNAGRVLELEEVLAAHEAAPQQEPDCWAILTPNGSRLVSPDEAKGRKDAYPLYAAPQQAQAPKVAVCDFVQVDDSSKSSRSQHDADSAELRSLCKARDEARRERGMLRAELAGHEASSGHLSAMVDELRALLAEAMAMMKALHESASPDDGPEMNAIVPAGAFREFVDANAALMHKIHISPHGDGAAAPQQGSNT